MPSFTTCRSVQNRPVAGQRPLAGIEAAADRSGAEVDHRPLRLVQRPRPQPLLIPAIGGREVRLLGVVLDRALVGAEVRLRALECASLKSKA